MKTFKCVLFSFIVFAGDVSHAAIVNLSRELGQRVTYTNNVMRTSLFHSSYGQLNSLTNRFTMSVDTVADTGSFTDMKFGVTSAGGGTRTQSITTVTPPTDFPNPPMFTTTTFTETVTLDPLSLAGVAPQFLSSTVGSIAYQGGFLYQFPSNVTVAFPADSFTVSGTYHVQGPTQMVTVPFSVLYSRTTANVANNWMGFIDVGTSFPDNARISAFSFPSSSFPGGYATYSPATHTILAGTVDGRDVYLTFDGLVIVAAIPIPEPMSVCLCVVAVIGCLSSRTLLVQKLRAVRT